MDGIVSSTAYLMEHTIYIRKANIAIDYADMTRLSNEVLTMFKQRTWIGCKKYREKQRKAKERKRLSGDQPDYSVFFVPPKLRRIVIVIDFDFGKVVKSFKFYRSGRIDTYNIVDEEGNQVSAGWNNFLKILSKCYPSVRRIYN